MTAVFIFFIAYFEHTQSDSHDESLLLKCIAICFAIAICASIALFLVKPAAVYTVVENESLAGDEPRFCGLFPSPAMMAVAAGSGIGLALFYTENKIVRYILLSGSLICLFLTLSRTFWTATITATIATHLVFYGNKKRYFIVSCWICGIVLYILASSLYISPMFNEVIRADSVQNLTGRTEIWDLGCRAFFEHPFWGHGVATGSEGLYGKGLPNLFNKSNDVRNLSRETLHNGFIQSLLDTGLIGTLFYMSILLVSLRQMLIYKHLIKEPCVFYLFIFLAVANMGESIIYIASMIGSVLFWGLTVFALSLPNKQHLGVVASGCEE
jgi:O-antigen ligase